MSPRIGRPTGTRYVPAGMARVTTADLVALRQIADREGTSVAQIVRRAIRREVERVQTGQQEGGR